MKITTIGRGSIGGTLARLWTAAGHQVNTLGREGGDASDADVVLVAVRHADLPAALAGVTGLEGKTVIEASNRLDGEAPHEGHASNAEYVNTVLGGPTAKAFKRRDHQQTRRRASPPARRGQLELSRPRPLLPRETSTVARTTNLREDEHSVSATELIAPTPTTGRATTAEAPASAAEQ